jgi:alkylhydroperoxidase family enzyme
VRFEPSVRELVEAVLTGPARLPPGTRRAAFDGANLAPALAAFVETVRHRAYDIGDGSVAALRQEGLDEDAIFELTIAAAVGAAYSQLQAGLRALEAADASEDLA